MYKKIFSQSDLVKRIEIIEEPFLERPQGVLLENMYYPKSFRFLKDLVEDLNTAKENRSRIRSAFKNALRFSYLLDDIRQELAHIPVFLTLRSCRRRVADPKLQEYIQAKNKDRCFDVPSKECPYDVLPSRSVLNFLKHERPRTVWSNYPKALAQEIGFEIIKTWETDDTLLDWFNAYIEQEPTTTALKVETDSETADIQYTLYFRSNNKPISTTQQLSIEQQVYDFIRQYAPLHTKAILEHVFEQDEKKRIKLFRILNRLKEKNLIENPEKGIYIPK